VFQYTSTPHIYDPDVFFKIERFIVPTKITNDFIGRRQDETLFVFPFDHNERSPEEAFADISDKLHSLIYPVLFLTNLQDISFEYPGVFGIYNKSVEKKQEFNNTVAKLISLTQNVGNKLYEDRLWLFSRMGENGNTYSVGFFLDDDGHLSSPNYPAFCFSLPKK